jgi:hypothetical protein
MKRTQNMSKVATALMDHESNLRTLTDRVCYLERQIVQITDPLGGANLDRGNHDVPVPVPSIKLYRKDASSNQQAGMVETSRSRDNVRMGWPNIIPFPGVVFGTPREEPAAIPLLALPGSPLPGDIPDYRPLLQRDGLVLLAWDKRNTEMGERYTAYWVTSAGTPRFYASKLLCGEDFPAAMPDHKSYAAEDGIEFYGQKAPAYIVHVAPELMMSNSRHRELRPAHIRILKRQGSKVDFDYKYLLTAEKNRKLPVKAKKASSQRAGA